jgi:hypothetical protein
LFMLKHLSSHESHYFPEENEQIPLLIATFWFTAH